MALKTKEYRLNVQSIFHSLDGEDNGFQNAGQLSTFIRLAGCNLKCVWCDTVYAQKVNANTSSMRIGEIIQEIKYNKLTVTGGEPLLQAEGLVKLLECIDKNARNSSNNISVTIETNGTFSTRLISQSFTPSCLCIRFVVDCKLGSSGESHAMKGVVFDELGYEDVIKFAIACPDDYIDTKEIIFRNPGWLARKVFSPVITKDALWPKRLAEMMIAETSPALFDIKYSLQLHKVLWPDAKPEEEH